MCYIYVRKRNRLVVGKVTNFHHVFHPMAIAKNSRLRRLRTHGTYRVFVQTHNPSPVIARSILDEYKLILTSHS